MGKDNRRIAAPSNCVSPNTFRGVKKLETVVKDGGLRDDGRTPDELRPMSLNVGLVPSVTGSAYLECGKTKIICSVNGPRDVLQKSDSLMKGQLFCEFKYATFSCKERQPYLPTDEECGISKAIQNALEPVILLHKFPKARLDIAILVLENGGGVVSAAITCAGAALSNAGVEMYDLPIGCNLVYNGTRILLDPTDEEESCRLSSDFAQITIGMMAAYNSQIIYMDSTGSLKPVLLSKGLKNLQAACQKILTNVRDCLKLHVEELSDGESAETRITQKIKAAELKLFQPLKYISAFLESNIRPDGRDLTEFRSVLINVGCVGSAYGSALVRLKDTSVLCGIKADLTNPTPEEPDKGFFVPNVTLTPICSNRFVPGPPTEQAQVYSQMIMDLWKNSSFLMPTTLCVAESKLSWCLFVEMICLSYDGNVLDACILALMAAMKNTKLPEVIINEEGKIEITDKFVPLNINCYIFPATYAILKNSVVADPSSEEENLANSSLTVFLKDDDTSSVHSFGSVKTEQIFHCIKCSKRRYMEIKSLLESLN